MNHPNFLKRLLLRGAQFFFLLLLPFFSLLRGGVWMHDYYRASPWLSMAGGFFLSGSLLFVYVLYLQHRMTGSLPRWYVLRWHYGLVLALMTVYCLPALMTLSVANAKTEGVRDEFTSLHPVLRLGVSTLIWVDPELVLTDAERVPEDYDRMGLSRAEHSLHFRQADGYAHAVDLRTRGRSSWRNALATVYFRTMGFRTYRHMGTADHLHISL